VSKIEHAVDYRDKRRAEYPSLADQLDAIFKGGTDFEEMRERIMAIKAAWPKNEEAKNNSE
jgi:hypothetical protein